MTFIRFRESELNLRLFGYSALFLYLMAMGLYIVYIIPQSVMGMIFLASLILVLVPFLISPLRPDSCIDITDDAIKQRTALFARTNVHWKDIRSIDIHRYYMELRMVKGAKRYITFYYLAYGQIASLKQLIKVKSMQKGIPLIDEELS
ncbi:MAG: hypothetical protein CL946_04580 [Ectothiorhodospiraceae bacterium]|nr:hypothetical protein [Ectothiorhodospiraceae bacterium]